jgi:hypothetical protein
MIATITNANTTANCFCLEGAELTYLNPDIAGQLNWSCLDLTAIYGQGVIPGTGSPGPLPSFPTPTLPNAISVMVNMVPTNPATDWDMNAWERFGGLILSVDVPVEIKYP